MEIEIEARQWMWSVHYPQLGTRLHSDGDPERTVMVVPKGRPVLLRATSKDVLHTLYVPAFRVKLDVIPGRESEVTIEATEVGRYSLACVGVCGKGHESMRAMIEVVEPAAMDPALEKAEADAAAAAAREAACAAAGVADCAGADFEIVAIDGVAIERGAKAP